MENTVIYPKYISVGKSNKVHKTWQGMRHRCNNEKFKIKWPTYRDCSYSENFSDFQFFAEWMTNQTGFSNTCHLDKDILFKGNKFYSENTCVLLPPKVNLLLIHKRFPDRGLPTGVSSLKCGGYVASVSREGRYDRLGTFGNVEDAFQEYKIAKEAEIKRVATEHKDVLDERAFHALMNYIVE